MFIRQTMLNKMIKVIICFSIKKNFQTIFKFIASPTDKSTSKIYIKKNGKIIS